MNLSGSQGRLKMQSPKHFYSEIYKRDSVSNPKNSYDFSPGGYSKLYPIPVESLN